MDLSPGKLTLPRTLRAGRTIICDSMSMLRINQAILRPESWPRVALGVRVRAGFLSCGGRTRTSAFPRRAPTAPHPSGRVRISLRDAPLGRATADTVRDKTLADELRTGLRPTPRRPPKRRR